MSEFVQINELLLLLKSLEDRRFSNNVRGIEIN